MVNCPQCEQVHHLECWAEIGGCGTYGCKQAPALEKAPATSPPLSAWGDTKKCPVCGETIKSIGQISRQQRVLDNEADYVDPDDMLAELCEDNKTLAARLREAHDLCDEHRDVATASLIEVWIDETEKRTWFLFETSRREMTGGH